MECYDAIFPSKTENGKMIKKKHKQRSTEKGTQFTLSEICTKETNCIRE